MAEQTAVARPAFITPDALLDHWQGHRRLTRRVIEAFPEDQLFTYTIGGMRPFGEMAAELLAMAAPMARGLATGEWETYSPGAIGSRDELLRLWDESAPRIAEFWAKIPPERFGETITSFGQYTGPAHWQVLYVIDNEVHHRAQGYVYLRALGIEPPPFYARD